jgi:hypothetical protein
MLSVYRPFDTVYVPSGPRSVQSSASKPNFTRTVDTKCFLPDISAPEITGPPDMTGDGGGADGCMYVDFSTQASMNVMIVPVVIIVEVYLL